uniref:DUF2334 domain-containing protein n=1 Tax=Desulfacinum infernum TaxID=35837 RepID=A0A831ZJF5_9BACT
MRLDKRRDGGMGASNRVLIVSFHDVTPLTYKAFAAFADNLAAMGVSSLTWLVVPLWYGRVFLTPESPCAQWLRKRQASGDAMVLHGLTHQKKGRPLGESFKHFFIRRVYTAEESEFLHLSENILRQKICLAKTIVEKAGIRPVGFVAPGWIFPPERQGILKEMGFRLTESYGRIYGLQTNRSVRVPVITASTRTSWRSLLSRAIVPALERLSSNAAVVRVAIHPADLKDPTMRRLWLGLIEKLRRRRQVHTLSSWAATVGL